MRYGTLSGKGGVGRGARRARTGKKGLFLKAIPLRIPIRVYRDTRDAGESRETRDQSSENGQRKARTIYIVYREMTLSCVSAVTLLFALVSTVQISIAAPAARVSIHCKLRGKTKSENGKGKAKTQKKGHFR